MDINAFIENDDNGYNGLFDVLMETEGVLKNSERIIPSKD